MISIKRFMFLQGLGDFCMDPYTWMMNTAVNKKYVDADTATYYMNCDVKATIKFEQQFDDCLTTVTQLEQQLQQYNPTDDKSKVS